MLKARCSLRSEYSKCGRMRSYKRFQNESSSSALSLSGPIRIVPLPSDHTLSVQMHSMALGTNVDMGLTGEEADRRLLQHGPNVLTEKKATPKYVLFLKELFTGFGPLYWAAAALCILSYEPIGGDDPSAYDLILGLIIIAVLLCTAIFRFIQLQSASNLMKHFLKMMPHYTSVLRDGRWMDVDSKCLVVGDVIRMTSGDRFPADVRALQVNRAKIDKSSLTGEAVPVRMTVDSTDEDADETRNIGFLGTNLVEGNLTAVVICCGDNTTMGRLASLSVTTKRKMTTLEKDVYYFTLLVAFMAFGFCALVILYWYFYLRIHHPNSITLPKLLTTCTGVMVALVPEGLAMAVTATLMMVAKSMRSVNVVVKDLNIIDTLGATTVICSDKTGTITQNKMTLSHVWMVDDSDGVLSSSMRHSVPALVGRSEAHGALDMLNVAANQANGWLTFILGLCGLCNNAQFNEVSRTPQGSPTDCALLQAANSSLNVTRLRTSLGLRSQIPFDSARKYQINVHHFSDRDCSSLITEECNETLQEKRKTSKTLAIAKGGSEIIIEMCKWCLHDGAIVQFTSELRRRAHDTTLTLADSGERVLAIAFSLLTEAEVDAERDEAMVKDQMVFAGLLSLTDPARPGVAEAIDQCRTAGIRVAMVTGDHPATAAAIARKVHIFTDEEAPLRVSDLHQSTHNANLVNERNRSAFANGSIIVLGKELATLTEDEWSRLLNFREVVFARTTPENKMHIVEHYQKAGQVVAVTGDGVNDAAALKKADIGIAMGIMGTEISKDAANVILQDDNFSSIVHGIEQGRLLFTNLRKVVCYLLPAGSFSEIIPVLANTFLGIPLPLSTFLMIVICMATDVIGSLGLVHELAESDIMRRKPRNTKWQHLVDLKVLFFTYCMMGVFESTIAFVAYFTTMYFAGGCHPSDLLFAFQWGVAPIPNPTSSNASTIAPLISTTALNNITFCDKNLDLDGQNKVLQLAQTAFFCSLVITQCWNLLSSRTRRASVFKQRLRRRLLFHVYGEISVILYVAYIPFMNIFLGTGPIDYYCYLIPLAGGVIIMTIEETRKYIIRHYPRSLVAKIAW